MLLAMIDRADVVVENFRPGVMDRLRLDYPTLADRNPGLVYASISGFGQSGPLRLKPAYDAVVQAMSGVMSITGEAEGRPAKPGVPISDIAGGLYAFGAITAALLGRAASGRGSYIDIGMYDSTLSLLESAGLSYLATGVQPPRIGNAHFSIAPFDTFACADRSIVICAANDVLFRQLCRVLDRPELITDLRYASNERRFDHRDILKAEMEATLQQRAAEDWLAELDPAGVPCSPILDVAEALGSAQAAARQMVVQLGRAARPRQPHQDVGLSRSGRAATCPRPRRRPGRPGRGVPARRGARLLTGLIALARRPNARATLVASGPRPPQPQLTG